MSQRGRKAQEGEVVRRLTMGAGAAALGLAWYFTASAATAVPIVFGAQPTGEGKPVSWAEQLDDRVFGRTVHITATSLRGPAGGVKSGTVSTAGSSSAAGSQSTAAGTATGQTATTPAGRVTSSGGTTVTTVTAPPPPPPPPTPAATTGGSTAK